MDIEKPSQLDELDKLVEDLKKIEKLFPEEALFIKLNKLSISSKEEKKPIRIKKTIGKNKTNFQKKKKEKNGLDFSFGD